MKKANVIYGPPGTGKSHEIMSRVAEVLKNGVDPKKVCLLSFTKVAALELAKRAKADKIHVSTIHSLAFKTLELTRDQVVSKTDLNDFSKKTGFKFTHHSVDNSKALAEGDFYLACYNLARANMRDPLIGYDTGIRENRCNAERYKRFVKAYEVYKTEYGLFDFADMLTNATSTPGPAFEYVFIDEAQDLSPAQWSLINVWLSIWSNVTIAGDDDQAIFKWGGADPHGMEKFRKTHDAHVQILSKSYRVPVSVHAKAQDVIGRIYDRVQKEYKPRDFIGKVSNRVSVGNAVSSMKHGQDILILYRNHSMRSEVLKYLHTNNLPYAINSGHYPLNSPLAKAAMIWKKAVFNKGAKAVLTQAQISLMKKVARPEWKARIASHDFSAGVDWNTVFMWDPKISQYLMAIDRAYGIEVRPTINLSTIHGAKGREADTVLVLNAVSARTYDAYKHDEPSEIRTFYVALTRAKKELIICRSSDMKHRMLGFI